MIHISEREEGALHRVRLSFLDCLPAVGSLLGFAIVCGFIGIRRFRWD